MQPKFISTLGLATSLAAFAVPASGQTTVVVDGDVNQIEGTISFTGASAHSAPLSSARVNTQSVGISPARGASANGTLQGPMSASYDVTVLASDLTHDVNVGAYMDGGRDYYSFEQKRSPAVPDEPGAPAQLSFSECTGEVTVRFVKSGTGAAADVASLTAYSRSETSAGSGAFGSHQSWTQTGATSSESFAVRGDGLLHRIEVYFKLGVVVYQQNFDREIACGEQSEIVIDLDEVEVIEPGSVIGNLDFISTVELANSGFHAVWGPYGNQGSDVIEPGFGPFEILDLAPSDLVDPADPYTVFGTMNFDTPWGRQSFTTPGMDVLVPAGTSVDLANAYVMSEGYYAGQVQLYGSQACMERIAGASSSVQRYVHEVGPSPYAGSGTQTLAGLVSPYDHPVLSDDFYRYNSAYRLTVGGPNDATLDWNSRFDVRTVNPTNGQFYSQYYLIDREVPAALIAPGSTAQANVEHCVVEVRADVNINSGLPVGSTFNAPRMNYSGSSSAAGADYQAWGHSAGWPASNEARGTSGQVDMCIPAGSYTFDTTVSSQSEAGVVSDTTLPQEAATLACGAIVKPFYFDVELTEVGCPGTDILPFTMEATALGGGGSAERAYYVINGGDEVDLCGGSAPACDAGAELSAEFSIDTSDLFQCGNEVEVFVISTTGDLSKSGAQRFAFEADGPSGPGCEDVDLTIDPLTGMANLDLNDVVAPLNECGLETQPAACRVGSTVVRDAGANPELSLTAGEHNGTCSLNTACGIRKCAFTATVTN